MNVHSGDSHLSDAGAASALTETRPFYWSVRRELWENRSLVVAPLVVTGLVLFASLIGMIGLPGRIRSLQTLDLAEQHVTVARPFAMAPAPIMLATILVGLFYSLDALYGDRRDRSILFWKSLPVSDLITVLSKAFVPLAVLPAIAFVLSVATVVCLMLLSTLILFVNGISPAPLWQEVRVLQQSLTMGYGLGVHALWFAPIYGWLLLVSAWARRSPLLWATLPLVVIAAIEHVVFRASGFASLLGYRVKGAMVEAFVAAPGRAKGEIHLLSQLDPWGFLGSPGLWTGLVFAALCLAVAVRLRRLREPI
jgi:ABC-2 type transport system permease protein